MDIEAFFLEQKKKCIQFMKKIYTCTTLVKCGEKEFQTDAKFCLQLKELN